MLKILLVGGFLLSTPALASQDDDPNWAAGEPKAEAFDNITKNPNVDQDTARAVINETYREGDEEPELELRARRELDER